MTDGRLMGPPRDGRLARVVIVTADGRLWTVVLVGAAFPDLAVVDAIARLQLAARRSGCRLYLEDVSARLGDLLDLAGLPREVGGQAEGREEAVGVQERVDPCDPGA